LVVTVLYVGVGFNLSLRNPIYPFPAVRRLSRRLIMKFLCLPGAYGSAKASWPATLTVFWEDWANLATQNFRVQLAPLADELEARGLATFAYTQGSHEVEPPLGWEDYFGARPLYRLLDTRHGDNFENLRRLRHMPYSVNAEDAMRMFQDSGEGEDWHQQVWRNTLDYVMQKVDENPQVDAIIGYSEGAMVGASLLVEEARQAQQTGREPRIKVRTAPGSCGPRVIDLANHISLPVVCCFHLRFPAPQVGGRQPRRLPARRRNRRRH
jgi:hypothetical protein